MSDLYICTGQFHVFCCLLLKLIDNKDAKSTIILVDCFEDARLYYYKLKKSNIFDRVLLLKNSKYEFMTPHYPRGIIGRVKMILNNRIFKKYENNFLKEDFFFDRIYIAGSVPAFNKFCIYKHKFENTKIFLYDDGLGPRLEWKRPLVKDLLFDYLQIHRFFSLVEGRYFFSPKNVIKTYPYKKILCQSKPVFDVMIKKGLNYTDLISKINKAYGYEKSNDPISGVELLYFSSGYDKVDFLKKFSIREVEIINYCFSINNRVVVKRHPDSLEKYDSGIEVLSLDYPIELSFLNNDLEDKILITSISTSVFNPSFIFDKTPYIILTYRLFDDDFSKKVFKCSISELDRRINVSLNSKYYNKDKVRIPKNFYELKNAIIEFSERIKY